MSTALKSIVARLASDEAFHQSFLVAPNDIVDDVALSPAERGALLRVHRRLMRAAGAGAPPPEWP